MATDRTVPGNGTPESLPGQELTTQGITVLRDRYFRARTLEGARRVYIGNGDGSFISYTESEQGDFWELSIRTPGSITEFTRYTIGVNPQDRLPYAKVFKDRKPPLVGAEGANSFKEYLDKEYPEPEIIGTPDGHVTSSGRIIGPDDADGFFTARAGTRAGSGEPLTSRTAPQVPGVWDEDDLKS